MNNIVVFASGSGSNFQAIIDAIKNRKIPAKICGLITNKTDIKAIDRAEKAGIPVSVIKPSDFETQKDFGLALLKQLNRWAPELIVLAGYMVKIPDRVIAAYRGKIINIHPSLLPKYGGKGYYGLNVHRAVIDAGESKSGCSVHIVDEHYDEGPVIAQREVSVKPDDTPERLAERILEKEHELLPEVIADLLTDNS